MRVTIPSELLEIPQYTHPQAQTNADVVSAYVILFSFYNDLKDKITLIKKRQEEQ